MAEPIRLSASGISSYDAKKAASAVEQAVNYLQQVKLDIDFKDSFSGMSMFPNTQGELRSVLRTIEKKRATIDALVTALSNGTQKIEDADAGFKNDLVTETISSKLLSLLGGIASKTFLALLGPGYWLYSLFAEHEAQSQKSGGLEESNTTTKISHNYTADDFNNLSRGEKQALIDRYERDHPDIAERFNQFLAESGVSEEDAENIKFMVYSAPEPYRSIYLEHLEDYNLKLKGGGGTHNILTNRTTVDGEKHFEQDPRGPYNSFFHESGHAVDDYEKHGFELISKDAYYSSEFKIGGKSIYDYLSDDIRNNIHSYLSDNYSNLSEDEINTILRSMNLTDDADFRWRARDIGLEDARLDEIRTEVIEHYYDNVLVGVEKGVICDAYGGMTNEVFFEQPTQAEIDAGVSHYGHAYNSNYWYDDSTSFRDLFYGGRLTPEYQTGKQAAELWADFFAAQMTHDEAALSLIKQHFPTAYAAMEKMALEMV